MADPVGGEEVAEPPPIAAPVVGHNSLGDDAEVGEMIDRRAVNAFVSHRRANMTSTRGVEALTL